MLPWTLVLAAAVLTPLAMGAVDIPVTDRWFGGFEAGKCVDVTTDLRDWKAYLRFSEEVHSIEIWVAVATKINSREYLLVSQDFNNHIVAGDEFCFVFRGVVTGNVVPKVTFNFDGVGDS